MNKQDIIIKQGCMYDPQSFFNQEKKCHFIVWVLKMCFLFSYTENAYIFLQSFLHYHNCPALVSQ